MPQRVRPGMVPAVGARKRGASVARIPSRSSLPREQVLEIQRSRLLAGALAAVDEQGYAAAMVGDITSRAGVSRRTFYELFENREACLLALIEGILAMLEAELEHAQLTGLAWRERVRGGLWTILSFFDREPTLARVCVVHALRGGPPVQALRERVFTRLAAAIHENRNGTRASDCSPLTAEGLVGAAFGILYARVARGERAPLTGLLGELMGMIVLPYQGPAAARAERNRPAPRAVVQGASPAVAALVLAERDPLQTLPMRVTYRTARVLECIECHPGVSNRGVADDAGIKDPGQVSKLLARLERLGLAQNLGEGARAKGEPNAWQLTPLGHQVSQRLRVNPDFQSEAA